MSNFLNSIALLVILLNPFLVIVYLIDLVQNLNARDFTGILIRGGMIGSAIFIVFALVGDALFSKLLHAEYANFQNNAGIVFLIVGIKYMLQGNMAIETLRGPPEQIAGSIAMPILVGPATVSASVMIGKTLPPFLAILGILLSVGGSVAVMISLKALHDHIKPRNEVLVQRYIEIAGRVLAIIIGIYAVEMIFGGATVWVQRILASIG